MPHRKSDIGCPTHRAEAMREEIVNKTENKQISANEQNGQRMAQIPTVICCGHVFCKRCLDRWATKDKHCPLCRTKMVKRITIFIGDQWVDEAVARLGLKAQARRRAEKRKREEDKDERTPPAKRPKKQSAATSSA